MNIKKAGEQIKNTVRAYLEKDENGRPLIPRSKQRPIFLMGPPGIGKTEIVSQVAAELGIGLLSYSMTHHTRQSVLGLPVIKKKEFEGQTFEASEYTMSEIISAVYDTMKRSGVRSGILFLDEINCVSETLTPVMLQFLQYKVFGGRELPDDWVVVTAGNPPEYNSSVREFDIVTWDRLKRIDVSPDLAVWKEFAHTIGVHGAVMSFLEIKPQHFYRIERSASGRSFVTARGWDDLSRMLKVYEDMDITADRDLVGQYLQDARVAEEFADYYQLYRKYSSEYRVGEILDGKADEAMISRAKNGGFDERYALLGLMLDTVGREVGDILKEDADMMTLKTTLGEVKAKASEGKNVHDLIQEEIRSLDDERERLIAANSLSSAKDDSILYRRRCLKRYSLTEGGDFESVKAAYAHDIDLFKQKLSCAEQHLGELFRFCNKAFGMGQELLIVLTEVAADPLTAKFISIYGCEEYYKYDKELMFHERRLEIIDELNKLKLSENLV